MKWMLGLVAAAACVVQAEVIDVPAGKTEKVACGRVFTGDRLVKTGAGTLDLSGAVLKNAGLEIREGAVRLEGGGKATLTTRYLKWQVTETRPGKKGPPEYAGSGAQFAEFHLYLDGKPLPRPKNATALNARPGHREGPQFGIDGDVKTKCYYSPFIADFGEEVTFDGYSFTTANDAIGRDPRSWTVEAGVADGTAVNWLAAGSVSGFEAPKARFAPAGKVFPISLRDLVPVNYPVKVCGKGTLVLVNANETLEKACGTGHVRLEGASVTFGENACFAGAVSGDGAVDFKKSRF